MLMDDANIMVSEVSRNFVKKPTNQLSPLTEATSREHLGGCVRPTTAVYIELYEIIKRYFIHSFLVIANYKITIVIGTKYSP